MKCENCSHAEMCKWIDELEGRGCDFYDDKPCELLILKSDILLHQDDRKKWAESIKREKESGVIILPPYFEPLLVPNDIEINIEQEPCDDAISREAVLKKQYRIDDSATLSTRDVVNVEDIEDEPSVTQKSGKWIEQIDHEENCRTLICSNCDRPALHDGDSIWVHKFCPHCGAKMESEDKK